MNSTRRIFSALAVVALMALGAATQADAAVVYLDPTPKTAPQGTTFTIDIWIKDLTESIGGFDVDISFDPTILSPDLTFGGGNGYTIDPDGNFSGDFSGGPFLGFYAPGVVNINVSGTPTGDNLALNDFRLGTIGFNADVIGESPLVISFLNVTDNADIPTLIDATSENGVVCVVDPNSTQVPVCPSQEVPEPTTMALLSLGVATLVGRRYARHQRQ